MKNIFNKLKTTALLAVASLSILAPTQSKAVMQCTELYYQQYCTDAAPRSDGAGGVVNPPIIPGMPAYGCWNWNRQFQCIETTSTAYCSSGKPYYDVWGTCNLANATIYSTQTINWTTYITNAAYEYRCAFGPWTKPDPLPADKECVFLNEKVEPTKTVYLDGTYGANPLYANYSTKATVEETKTRKYVCYDKPITTCNGICFRNEADPITGVVHEVEYPCPTPSEGSCSTASNQCSSTFDQTRGEFVLDIGPDGRCVKSVAIGTCASGAANKCLDKPGCTLTETKQASTQVNSSSLRQVQTYTCTGTTTTCKEQAEVSNCTRMGAWGWDKRTMQSQVGQGLAELNQAIGKVEGIQKGVNTNDPHVFSGKDLRCKYAIGNFLNTFITVAVIAAMVVASGGAGAVFAAGTTTSLGVGSSALVSASGAAMSAGLTTSALTVAQANAIMVAAQVGSAALSDAKNSRAFGSDCCKEYVIDGSDSWYKMGSCTADEVRLAVARSKGLHHYIGEYCSKKAGFPVRQCVQKTRTFCVFDDMLALTVNEEGRKQLENIALTDSATIALSPDVTTYRYGNPGYAKTYKDMATGAWAPLPPVGGSKIYQWVYPAYCSSDAAQKAAYDQWMREVWAVVDTKGTQPELMMPEQAAAIVVNSLSIPPFQECPEIPGTVPMLTCTLPNDGCDIARMPPEPLWSGVDTAALKYEDVDLNWRVQTFNTFQTVGMPGVTATLPSDSSFAAVAHSLNDFVTAIGSCRQNSNVCKFRFEVTDKYKTGGMGARKRVTDHVQFPLYTMTPDTIWPAQSFLSLNGTMDWVSYSSDVNKGAGTPSVIGSQRFIFRPNFTTKLPPGGIHSHVLLEWANSTITVGKAEKDYSPLLVPTKLPVGTSGWYPYGNAGHPGQHFFMSGGCEPTSKWCDYKVEVNLNIPRHPWGSPKSPRCWGFTIDQMAALDFDKMDLSRWVTSLNLNASSANLSKDAATAMTNQVTESAQTFYTAFRTGGELRSPTADSSVVLHTNSEIFPLPSGEDFRAYVMKVAVPSNWPQYYVNGVNDNPVSSVYINWGAPNVPSVQMVKDVQGMSYLSEFDYGDVPPGRYKVTVTMLTAKNGPQTVSTYVTLQSNKNTSLAAQQKLHGTTLDYSKASSNSRTEEKYNPSEYPNGTSLAPDAIKNLAPGMVDKFDRQGTVIQKSEKP